MLKVHLPSLDRGPVRLRERLPLEVPLWREVASPPTEPPEVDLVAEAVGDGVLVRGGVRATLGLQCRRCLADVRFRIDEEVAFWYRPLDEEGADDAESYPLPPGNELDLAEAVVEQIVLHTPLAALCRNACKGLCPGCGIDLNLDSCDCAAPAEPSPWEGLRQLSRD